MRQKFDITGMTCSACSAHVEKSVRKLGGINSVNVNLLKNSMVVEYDENTVDDARIIQAVIGGGYGASVAGAKQAQAKDTGVNDEIKSMKKRLIISIISQSFFIIEIIFSIYSSFVSVLCFTFS